MIDEKMHNKIAIMMARNVNDNIKYLIRNDSLLMWTKNYCAVALPMHLLEQLKNIVNLQMTRMHIQGFFFGSAYNITWNDSGVLTSSEASILMDIINKKPESEDPGDSF